MSSCRRLASTVGSVSDRRSAPLSSITFEAANSSAPSSTPPAERVSFSSVCSCANESRDACDITQLHLHSWSRPVLFPDLPGSGQRHVVNVHHRQALRPRSWTPVVLQEYRLRYAVRQQPAVVRQRSVRKPAQRCVMLQLMRSGVLQTQSVLLRCEPAPEFHWLRCGLLAAAARSCSSVGQLLPVQPERARVHLRSHHGVRRRISPRSEEHTSELQSRGHLVCRLLL